jgi:hypothetical protein
MTDGDNLTVAVTNLKASAKTYDMLKGSVTTLDYHLV